MKRTRQLRIRTEIRLLRPFGIEGKVELLAHSGNVRVSLVVSQAVVDNKLEVAVKAFGGGVFIVIELLSHGAHIHWVLDDLRVIR